MGPLRIRHLAGTKWNALGGKVLAWTFLSHMAGRSLPFQCFHSPVRFLFLSFPSHGKSADLCCWAWLWPWLSTPGSAFTSWWSAAVSTGPVSLTAQPSAPSWQSTTWKKKGGVSIQILPLASHRYYRARQRQAVDVFPRRGGGGGGFRGVADFVHGKMDGMHVWSTAWSSTFEAFPRTRAFVFTLPWLYCILASQGFNFFSSDRHFSSDKFSFGSSWPLCFFFHLCLLSFSVLSSKESLHIGLVLFGNLWKTYQHQSVGKRWNESLFSLPAEQLAHPNMYTQQVLTILKVLTEYRLA